MKDILANISVYLTLVISLLSCNANNTAGDFNEFALYSTKEVFDSAAGYNKMIPVIDRYISIPANQSLINTATILLDSVSANNFNNLKLEVTGIYFNKDSLEILKVNLKENPGFKMPDSLGHYRSWYDFFQGSMGGGQTTIILIESALQKQFNDNWVDAAEFYYQNEKIGEWDHVYLSGIIKRR
jgi:hypothetical protein